MNILLVSQCNKRALTETRRILDQFAERRGDRTWQTSITQAGLITLRKLLRKTARKNTAVACHWIRGKDHSELLWIVGDAGSFNESGATPTNTTLHDVLRAEDENTWHSLHGMRAVVALAALLHDIGKAIQAFQDRLAVATGSVVAEDRAFKKNHYRHEWVSVRLFQAFVGENADNDHDWLQKLADGCDTYDTQSWEAFWISENRLIKDGLDAVDKPVSCTKERNPFKTLPPLAQAVAWLILTHHRLPAHPVAYENKSYGTSCNSHDGVRYKPYGAKPAFINDSDLSDLLEKINADWNAPREDATFIEVKTYWTFPEGVPVSHPQWRKQAAREAKKLLRLSHHQRTSIISDPFQMHVSRLSLMLADHYYSRLNVRHTASGSVPVAERSAHLYEQSRLYANTYQYQQKTYFNQSLEEHLLGVHAHANLIVHSLPALTRSLPHLKNHKVLRQRGKVEQFRWQDKAADIALGFQKRSEEQGAFIVNMASTGCGKTLGNARIMYALSDRSRGMRCAFAMGLRTLTLQTGRSFQNDIGLDDERLAILVGGQSSKELFKYHEAKAEETGSASQQALLDESGDVLYEGDNRHPLLLRLSDDSKVQKMLAAPVLVCTVDHLMPATESLRGGRQIAPMLRLMSSDLVLDEPDDFDLNDLPALTRLVHWAGLLGARVLLSSATLPPALINGLFQAYRDGRIHYQRNRGERPGEAPEICCLWVDEFHQHYSACIDKDIFKQQHAAFVEQRVKRLAQEKTRRIAELIPLSQLHTATGEYAKQARRILFAEIVRDGALRLHNDTQNHTVDGKSGKKVSFGLIRMANIGPIFDVALALYKLGAPQDVRIHLCVYHSQYPLFLRSDIEHRLDTCLNRRSKNTSQDPALAHQDIRERIDQYPEKNHLFIVLGSPVTEVGRDHDYDWAVVEPSSVRSMIQLAGRVRRHRQGEVQRPNILILDHNLKHFDNGPGSKKAAYCKPGFEGDQQSEFVRKDGEKDYYLKNHDMHWLIAQLLDNHQQWRIDAVPRIKEEKKGHILCAPMSYLEHRRMASQMLNRKADDIAPRVNARTHWARGNVWLTGVLPQYQRFRENTRKQVDVVFLPDDDQSELSLYLVLEQKDSVRAPHLYVPIEKTKLTLLPQEAVSGTGIVPWAGEDAVDLLEKLSEELEKPLTYCAQRYATVSLPDSDTGWRYHSVLGFALQ
jgi:CRISPR-associated endonuclease/helicase Cas3